MKRYINTSIVYTIIAMVAGVFYREFTKLYEFTGKTNLSVMHTHYFMLGMVFFILLLLLEKSFCFTNANTNKTLILYNVGLNLTGIMMFTRGITQATSMNLSSAMDMSISGIAGIGHILLSVAVVLILVQIKRAVSKV